ncbi:MAG TPA: MXAN_6640 family putative metalloprotease [Bacteroidota bacterium]
MPFLAVTVAWSQPDVSQRLERLEFLLTQSTQGGYARDGKCATPMIFQAVRNMSALSAAGRAEVRQILQRPPTHLSRLSPSGNFRIHYDTSGTHQPAMLVGVARVSVSHEEFVDSVGSVFDQCWDAEIGTMGFDPPPPDKGEGGGNEYDVYIQALLSGTFGLTSFFAEDSLETGPRQRYPTYITIDRDFLGERTPGLDGLRVTAAHEFHHAIQVGAYAVWENVPNSDFWFYELTSVWFEEAVFDDINDYYYDVPLFFQGFKDNANRSLSFATSSPSGYERSVWALYLVKRFGRDVIRQIWEQMKAEPALFSMATVLERHESGLPAAFAEFAVWNLFTAHRADPAFYYEEGGNFPVMGMNATAAFPGAMSSMSATALPWSLQYYEFTLPGDTVVAAISSVRYSQVYSGSTGPSAFDLVLSKEPGGGGTQRLENGLTMSFVTAFPEDWRTKYVSLVSRSDLRNQSPVGPNPLILSESPVLTLPVDGSSEGNAEVFLLTASLDLAFSGRYQVVTTAGKSLVTVPGKDFSAHVSSGVHFVAVKTKEKEYTWKLVIIR